MKRFLILILILAPLTTLADYRFNIPDPNSCGPIRHCFVGDTETDSRLLCTQNRSRCTVGPGEEELSVCYWVEDCAAESSSNPGTIGPLYPPNLPPDFCVINPQLCVDGQPAPIEVDPEYTPPEAYVIDERVNNPIQSTNVGELLDKLFRAVIIIVVPLLVLALVYTGLMFVTAQGNEEKLKTAKRNAKFIIIGIIIIMGARIFISIAESFINALE